MAVCKEKRCFYRKEILAIFINLSFTEGLGIYSFKGLLYMIITY